MAATTPRRPAAASDDRFRTLFDRSPDERELARFTRAHELLVLRLPARVRRRTARAICRL